MGRATTDTFVTALLNNFNKELADHLKGDVLAIRAPIRFGVDDLIRREIENLNTKPDASGKRPKLIVVLETSGGQIEIVERIYRVFRHNYTSVDFIVPNFAYSAGTVLVLSGDSIYMDYYSVLGPIDPQYESDEGKWVPGLGYVQKFKELRDFINTKGKPPEAYRAELAYLIKKFDPALLFRLEQAKNHSVSLLQEWLPKHKFKDWKQTAGRGKSVTAADRKKRAKEIAEILSNPERWNSHGRGIGLRELTSDEIKLQIVDFGADAELSKRVNQYYNLFIDYCYKLGLADLRRVSIHSQGGLRMV